MITTITHQTMQMEIGFEIDSERLERLDWQRAIDHDLHALQDYIDPDQLIIWRPGIRRSGTGKTTDSDRQAFDVQLTTTTSCTCSRFRLRDRCEHVAFARKLESSKTTPGPDTVTQAKEAAS